MMYNTQEKKMVIILHDTEGMNPWLMSTNLYFTIRRCQDRVQGNEVTVQYFSAMLNCHNTKQCLKLVSNIYRKNYELLINVYTHMYRYIHMHIYVHIHTLMHLEVMVRRPIYYSNARDHHVKLDTGRAAIVGPCVLLMILWSRSS